MNLPLSFKQKIVALLSSIPLALLLLFSTVVQPITLAGTPLLQSGTTPTVYLFLPFVSQQSSPLTDCPSIQQAINALPASGGSIAIPSGTFTCSTPIVIDRDNVDLRGQGPATVLRIANGANAPVLVLGQTLAAPNMTRSNIHVSDLVIDGNRLNQTVECWGGTCDPSHFIRNNGITLRRVSDVLIEHVTTAHARSGGLVAEKGSRRVTVRDFNSFDNQFDGIAAYETEDSLFSGTYLHENLAAGFSFDIQFNNNIIEAAVITASGTVGVFMRDSRDNVFQGLQIRNSAQHGLFLARVDTDDSKSATGNTFSGIVVSGSGGAGFRVNNSSCVDNLVVESQFFRNAGGCISEAVPGLVPSFGVICR